MDITCCKTFLSITKFLIPWPWPTILTYFWKKLNLRINFWTLRDKGFILHIDIPYSKTFLSLSIPIFFYLWPWPPTLTYFWKKLSFALIENIRSYKSWGGGRKDQNIWLYNSLLKLRIVIWSDNNHSVDSCSVLNLNYPFWHETCKLSNNNGLNFSNVKHDKKNFYLYDQWHAFTYTSNCAWCYLISYVKGSIVSFYIVLCICTYLLNLFPRWHPRAHQWAHLKLLLQYKTLSLWVLGGWTSHLALLNIC